MSGRYGMARLVHPGADCSSICKVGLKKKSGFSS